MEMIITNPGRHFESRPLSYRKQNGPLYACAVLTNQRDQEMLGFGAALTDSSCVLFNRMEDTARDELLKEIFSPAQMNFSVARICVGASDYAAVPYDFAPVRDDMEMEHFDASHDLTNCIPVIKKAQDYNPDLYIYSSPWSPPGWMKTSGSTYGGWMREKYIKTYAKYYLKFIQYYKEHGIKISALTPQNETETDQSSKMPACLWHPEIEMLFVKEMRRLLNENGFEDLKIWILDHNFPMWHRVIFQLADQEVKKSVSGVAWHPYEGHPEMISWVRGQYPDIENHWTEGELISTLHPDYSRKTYSDVAHSFITAINNGIQSVTVWNLALDENGQPNIGPFGCRGAIEISSDGKNINRSAVYYVLGHFSRYVKRGAKRIVIENQNVPAHFGIAAFENPDGQIVAVISNTEKHDSPMSLKIGDNVADLWILANSVTTVLL